MFCFCDMFGLILTRYDMCGILQQLVVTSESDQTELFAFADIRQDKTGRINANQLGRVLDRINLAMKRQQLNSTYDKFGKVIGLDRTMRRKGLTFEQCCTFLHKLKRDSWMVKPVTVIWNDLFGEFMNNGKQR